MKYIDKQLIEAKTNYTYFIIKLNKLFINFFVFNIFIILLNLFINNYIINIISIFLVIYSFIKLSILSKNYIEILKDINLILNSKYKAL